MVELILALMVFQVGLLAVAGMVYMAQRNFSRAELTLRGMLEAGWVADSLGKIGGMDPGSRESDWGTLVWEPMGSPVPAVRVSAIARIGGDTLATVLGFPPLSSAPFPLRPDTLPEGGG